MQVKPQILDDAGTKQLDTVLTTGTRVCSIDHCTRKFASACLLCIARIGLHVPFPGSKISSQDTHVDVP